MRALLAVTMLVGLAILLAGCSSSASSQALVYLHDGDVEERLKTAKQKFANVTSDSRGIWANMRANLNTAAAVEASALSQAANTARLTALQNIENWSWPEIRLVAETAEGEASTDFDTLATAVLNIAAEIARLRQVVREDPGGDLEDDQAATLDADIVADLQALSPAADDALDYLKKAQEFIAKAQNDVLPKLDKYADAEDLNSVLDVLRRINDLDQIDDLQSLLEGVSEPESIELPARLAEAIRDHLGMEITTVGELMALAGEEDTGLKEISLTLLSEGMRTASEMRRVQFETLVERLRLANLRIAIVSKRLEVATDLRVRAEHFGSAKAVASLEADIIEFKNAADGDKRQQAREKFEDKVFALTEYVELIGTLDSWDRITTNSVALAHHRERIARAEVAATAYERLVDLGLEGAIVFAEGGITEEQIANWIRAAQTAGIAVIAAD